jgi:uncharacterized protein
VSKTAPAPSAAAGIAPFFHWDGSTLVLNVLGKPGAKRDAIGRVVPAPGGERLAVHVAAAPEGGKATQRLVAFLAREFGVSKSAVELVYGLASVNKQLRIHQPTRLFSGITLLSSSPHLHS